MPSVLYTLPDYSVLYTLPAFSRSPLLYKGMGPLLLCAEHGPLFLTVLLSWLLYCRSHQCHAAGILVLLRFHQLHHATITNAGNAQRA